MRALLVEDEPSWREVLGELLEEQGLEVDRAARLEEARELLRARSHRVAVVDLSLGGPDHANRDGLRVLELLRRHDPGCRAILVSGHATVEIAVRALTELGALSCMRKEAFSRRDFAGVVRRALAAPPERAAAAVPPPASRGAALLVEDDAGWRELLEDLLRGEGFTVRAAASFGEALAVALQGGLRLAVLDLSLASSLAPERNRDGLRLLEACREAGVPALVVSGTASPEVLEEACRRHGARAVLEKQGFQRGSFVRLLREIAEPQAAPGGAADVTEREAEVLALLVEGLTNPEIAERLVISPNTVKRHLKAIFDKLGVRTRAAAVARALERRAPGP